MKILALDGGGVFGKAQAKIIGDANCVDKFDCFAGTSIGSAISAALALGVSPSIGLSFFDTWMPIIFRKRWWRSMNPFVSKYPDDGLNDALQCMFDSARLGDVKKPLFVTTANIGQRTLKVYDSTNFDDARIMMWEVIRSATAAQTYFSPWKGMADGGVFANNPSMVGVASAVRVLKVPIHEVEVLSIGTGRSTEDGEREPGCKLMWGFWLIDALLTGASDDMHDYFVRSLPLKNYVRVQFLRDADWKMDSVRDMNSAITKWTQEMVLAEKVMRGF